MPLLVVGAVGDSLPKCTAVPWDCVMTLVPRNYHSGSYLADIIYYWHLSLVVISWCTSNQFWLSDWSLCELSRTPPPSVLVTWNQNTRTRIILYLLYEVLYYCSRYKEWLLYLLCVYKSVFIYVWENFGECLASVPGRPARTLGKHLPKCTKRYQ